VDPVPGNTSGKLAPVNGPEENLIDLFTSFIYHKVNSVDSKMKRERFDDIYHLNE